MNLLALFFAGAFLCNAVPHLASGLTGQVFPTPFARPHGRGPSSPLVNFLWGAFNALVGLALLSLQPPEIGWNLPFAVLCLGALPLGGWMAHHFGTVRRNNPGFGAP